MSAKEDRAEARKEEKAEQKKEDREEAKRLSEEDYMEKKFKGMPILEKPKTGK